MSLGCPECRISEVESNTFAGLRSLRSLDLSNNQLAIIHPEAFTVLNQSLQELNLSRALYNHSTVMDLATSLRWSSLGTLQGLDLSHNSLIYLPSRIFSHLTSLRRLQLSNNSLVAIHNATFSGRGAPGGARPDPQRPQDGAGGGPARAGLPAQSWPSCWGRTRSRARVESNLSPCGSTDHRDASATPIDLVCAFPASMRNTSMLAVGTLTLGCLQRGRRGWPRSADLLRLLGYSPGLRGPHLPISCFISTARASRSGSTTCEMLAGRCGKATTTALRSILTPGYHRSPRALTCERTITPGVFSYDSFF